MEPLPAMEDGRRRWLVVVTLVALLAQVTYATWIGLRVLPTDAQAPVAIWYLAPTAQVVGAAFLALARPSIAASVFVLLLQYATFWAAMLPWAGAGVVVLSAVLLVPTALAVALVSGAVQLLARMLRDLRTP